jgi:glucose 1-dehydrogenase
MTMRALSVIPGQPDSLRLEQVPEPPLSDGAILVSTVAMGLCGTDLDIVEGGHGKAPAGEERLILGHESVARVAEAPPASGFAPGDWVVSIVRRPDPVPCANCAVGEWDMCRNGRYTERGIVGRHGFGSERYRSHAEFLVPIDAKLGELGVLMEPTSVVAKAWEHSLRIGQRARFEPRRALITGAGPIGLLAALLGVQRGLDVHVLDRVTDGPKPELVRALGASYHTGAISEVGTSYDLVFECTGAPALFFDAIRVAAPDGVVCLAGVSSGGHTVCIDAGLLNRELVLENNAIFGSVNANRRHFEQAAAALAKADREWLGRLLTRRVPIERFSEAFRREPDDVKTILTFG